MKFSVDLAQFRGPLDLLLHLVRKHELEVVEVSIHRIVDQFLEHLSAIETADVDQVGDFLETAGLLVELKSRQLLPSAEEDLEEAVDDPREDLVRRLLEYKQFRDVASLLGERGAEWRDRFTRQCPLGGMQGMDREGGLRDAELWDLMAAFARLSQEHARPAEAEIYFDETPTATWIERIEKRLKKQKSVSFSSLFEPEMDRSAMVGLFLALLEMVRHGRAREEQNGLFAEIWLTRTPNPPKEG